MSSAIEITNKIIDTVVDIHEYKEQAKKLSPFAAEYMLHSFSLTFRGGVDLLSDKRQDERYIQKEFDACEEPAQPAIDPLMNSETKFNTKRRVVTPVPIKT